MDPQRTKTISGHTVSEYYWNGRMTVYVDNQKYDGDFDSAVAEQIDAAESIRELKEAANPHLQC